MAHEPEENFDPVFSDERGFPDRYYLYWIAVFLVAVVIEVVFTGMPLGVFLLLGGLPFAVIANLALKQGQFYDVRYGYTKTDTREGKWYILAAPAIMTLVTASSGIFIISIRVYRGY